ncbi:MAG: RNA polymerase sigma-70 factor [Tannerellaceae bacterium]|nr:RNA polymerase sigma-70 factor [Tannerellaceae bacterium]
MPESEIHPSTKGQAWLRKIAAGDEHAFRSLFDTYYQRLFHLALFYLKSKELSEEAVSDVFYIIWKRKEALTDIQDIEKYLYISVKHQCLHYIRKNTSDLSETLELYNIEYLPDEQTPELNLMDQEYRELVQEAIFSLPEKCREVFRLELSDKLKQKEIADLLDISIKTVEAHIATAYKRIGEYVNKKYNKPDKKKIKLFSLFTFLPLIFLLISNLLNIPCLWYFLKLKPTLSLLYQKNHRIQIN